MNIIIIHHNFGIIWNLKSGGVKENVTHVLGHTVSKWCQIKSPRTGTPMAHSLFESFTLGWLMQEYRRRSLWFYSLSFLRAYYFWETYLAQGIQPQIIFLWNLQSGRINVYTFKQNSNSEQSMSLKIKTVKENPSRIWTEIDVKTPMPNTWCPKSWL